MNNAQQGMATFSFVLGILSLIMLLFGLGLPAGALGLVLALLSRGGGSFLPRAKTGLILSAIGLAVSLIITLSSIVMIRSGALQETFDEMRNVLETTYEGDEADELIQEFEEMLGITAAPSAEKGGSGK